MCCWLLCRIHRTCRLEDDLRAEATDIDRTNGSTDETTLAFGQGGYAAQRKTGLGHWSKQGDCFQIFEVIIFDQQGKEGSQADQK